MAESKRWRLFVKGQRGRFNQQKCLMHPISFSNALGVMEEVASEMLMRIFSAFSGGRVSEGRRVLMSHPSTNLNPLRWESPSSF